MHVQAGAEDAVLRDHEIVVELGADHDHGVEAVAAVDAHRGVDRVLDEVVAGAAADEGVGQRAESSCEPRAANAWTMNVSSPASPFRSSTARLWKTMNVSLPLPPLSVIGLLMPLLSQPCVVSIVAKTSSGATPDSFRVRRELVELADLEEVRALAAVDVDDRADVVDVDLVARRDVAVRDRVERDVLELRVVVDALDRVERLDVVDVRRVDQCDEREAGLGRRGAQRK